MVNKSYGGRPRQPRDNAALAALTQRIMDSCDPPTQNQAGHIVGTSAGTIGRMLDGEVPTREVLEKVARVFPWAARELYEAVGYPMPLDLVPSVAAVAQRTGRDPHDIVEDAVRAMFDGE